MSDNLMVDTSSSKKNLPIIEIRGLHKAYGQLEVIKGVSLSAPRGHVISLIGSSGSGKSTLAHLVEEALHRQGIRTYVFDGDNVRHGLNKDLGFTDADRIENIRRIGEVAKLMTDAGLIVLTAFISPFRAERELVRAMLPEGEFVEIFVDTPLEVAETRDVTEPVELGDCALRVQQYRAHVLGFGQLEEIRWLASIAINVLGQPLDLALPLDY